MFLKKEYLSGSSSPAIFFFRGDGVRGLSTLGLPGRDGSIAEGSRLSSLPFREIVGLERKKYISNLHNSL
jgi:hypothetical protein